MEIKKHIFRGYDIRGIYGEDLDEEVAYQIGKGFGSYISEIGKTKAIVGRDNRESSVTLEKALIDANYKDADFHTIYVGEIKEILAKK